MNNTLLSGQRVLPFFYAATNGTDYVRVEK